MISSENDLSLSPVVADSLAAYIANGDYARIPADTVAIAKQLILDTLAVAWAGSDAAGCKEVRELFRAQGGQPESSVWAFGDKLPALGASFINSAMAAALDYDSLYEGIHVAICVLPAALAVAERQHASGTQFLTAFIIGSDIVGRFTAGTLEPRRGWWYTPLYGTFGACAAAGKLLQLSALEMRDAIGIAYAQTGGTLQHNVERTLTKRIASAFSTRAGVLAALLAERGITGPRKAIEGEFGLYQMYQPGNQERLLDQLGSHFELGRSDFKKFPSCVCNHTAIEASLRLVQEYDLHPADIESVEVVISPYMAVLVGSPFNPNDNPQVAAQLSIQYAVACAIVRRRLGIPDIQPSSVMDPSINDFVKRIQVVIDQTSSSARASELIIATHRYGLLRRRIEQVPGSPEAPLTELELRQKVRECFSVGARPMTTHQCEALFERIMSVEKIQDMNDLFTSLV